MNGREFFNDGIQEDHYYVHTFLSTAKRIHYGALFKLAV